MTTLVTAVYFCTVRVLTSSRRQSRAGVGGERPRQTKALAGAEKPRKKAKERRGDPSGAAAAGAKKRKKKRPDPAE